MTRPPGESGSSIKGRSSVPPSAEEAALLDSGHQLRGRHVEAVRQPDDDVQRGVPDTSRDAGAVRAVHVDVMGERLLRRVLRQCPASTSITRRTPTTALHHYPGLSWELLGQSLDGPVELGVHRFGVGEWSGFETGMTEIRISCHSPIFAQPFGPRREREHDERRAVQTCVPAQVNDGFRSRR